MPPPTYQVPPERQGQWQPRLSRASRSTQPSTNAIFTPLAIETAGPFTPETFSFLRGLGCRLKQVTREAKSFFYLRQCLLTLSNGKCHCSDGNNGGHHLQYLFLFLTAFPSLGSSECFPFSYLTVFCLFMLLLFPVTVLKMITVCIYRGYNIT